MKKWSRSHAKCCQLSSVLCSASVWKHLGQMFHKTSTFHQYIYPVKKWAIFYRTFSPSWPWQLDGVSLNEPPANFAFRRLFHLPPSLSTHHLPFSFFFSSSFWWCIPVCVFWPSSADALNKMTDVICFCHRVSPPAHRLKNTVLEGRECVCRV